MKLGSNIQQLCAAQGMTLSKLAKQSGVPVQTLHAWTTGRKSVSPVQLKNVASVLKVSLHELLFGEPDPHEVGDIVLKEIFSGDVRVTLQRIERRKNKGD